MRIYKNNSNPLVEVPLYELSDGDSYVTDEGQRVRYDENKNELNVIQNSELVQGEDLGLLNDKQLKLYWTLMTNKAK